MVTCRLPRICPGEICGVDVDDLFPYTTTKMVKIRDARLGLLSYLLMLAIFVYIVVIQLIAKGGYLIRIPATSTVRLTLQQPTINEKGKTCNPNDPDCDDNFTPLDKLNYCWREGHTQQVTPQGSFPTLNCTYLDGGEVSVTNGNSIMMATSVHQYKQHRNNTCEDGAYSCKKIWDIGKEEEIYVVDPERFTLLIDHTLAAKFNVDPANMKGLLHVGAGKGNKRDLQNQLCDQDGAVDAVWGGSPTKTAPCYVPPHKAAGKVGKDFFSIGDLLKSQGVSLDDRSDASPDNTTRLGGLIFNLNIEYSNFYLFSMGAQKTVHYTYELGLTPKAEYKHASYVNTHYPDVREKLDLHGILFNVQPTGEIAEFDFTTLLLQITTSLALFALVTTAMNILAQYVLAYSSFYKHLMYQNSHDFSDLRDADALTEEELSQALTEEGVPTHGNRVERIIRLLDNGWKPPSSQVEGLPTVSTGSSLQRPLASPV